MFDVYLNEKRDRLLVISRGRPIPVIENTGRWRKKKATRAVSDEIKSAVQRDGFYSRRLSSKSPVAAQRLHRTDMGN
jgi:hypothetical protein